MALDYLSHNKSRVRITSQSAVDGLAWDQKEHWYSTEYTLKKLNISFFMVSTGLAVSNRAHFDYVTYSTA